MLVQVSQNFQRQQNESFSYLQKQRQHAEIDGRRKALQVNVESIKFKLQPIDVSPIRQFPIF